MTGSPEKIGEMRTRNAVMGYGSRPAHHCRFYTGQLAPSTKELGLEEPPGFLVDTRRTYMRAFFPKGHEGALKEIMTGVRRTNRGPITG
jgi:hypothetical protein